MATRKKAKAKARTKKKVKRRLPAKKRALRRPAAKKKKKSAGRKAVKKKVRKKADRRPARKATPTVKTTAVAIPANEARVGIVTHYFSHLTVAVIRIETGALREGDTIHIKGHTSDFRQRVSSMEVDHVHVAEARPGQSIGLKVSEHAREHDIVYRVTG